VLARPYEISYPARDIISEAAVRAARERDTDARAFLVAMLDRDIPQSDVLRVLGELRATEAVPALLSMARRTETYLSRPAVETLAAIGDARAYVVLLEALQQREDEWVGEHGANGLARLGVKNELVLEALREATKHKTHTVRGAALAALGDLGAVDAL